MSKINLDLAKFKHVKTDKGMTTLRHKDGHELTISHNSLSPEFRKQLEALNKISKDTQTSTQANEQQNQSTKMAKGGEVKDKADYQHKEHKFHVQDSGNGAGYRLHHENTKTKEYTTTGPFQTPAQALAHAKELVDPEYAQGGEVEKPKERVDKDKAADASKGAQQGPMETLKNTGSNIMKGLGLTPDPQYEKEHKASGGEVEFPKTMHEDRQPASEPISYPTGASPSGISVPPRGDLPGLTDVPTEVVTPDNAPPHGGMNREEALYNIGLGDKPMGEQYSTMYNKNYTGALREGLSEEQARNFALKRTEQLQQGDVRSAQRMDQKSVNDFQKVVQERERMKALGIPDQQLPPLPAMTPTQQAMMQQAVPQAAHAEQQILGEQPKPQQPQKQNDFGLGETEDMMRKGMNQQLSGIQQHAEAQGQLGQQQAAVHDQRARDEQTAANHYTQTYNDLMQERHNMIDDIRNGHIDPDKYWDNHSKIATGIGMILAGFNPTNNPNAAVNFLKFQMENNLNAQRENLNSKQNLLRANMHQFGELRAATDMTRIMQNDIVAHKLDSAAGQAASPIAKAAALQASGQLRMQSAQLFQQFAMRRAMMQMAGNGGDPGAVDQMLGYMRVVNPEMAKEMETRYIPGVGMAKIPVPQAARDAITAHSTVDRLLNEALKLANTPDTALSPEQRMRGQTLMGEIQSAIRIAEGQGVYKESEANFMSKLLGDNPAGFLAKIKTEPKLLEMQRIKQAEHRALRNQYGLPMNDLVRQQQQHEQQQAVTGKDGRQYQKQIINGKAYMVPVGPGSHH